MNRTLLLISIIFLGSSLDICAADEPVRPTQHILFIGNSYTYGNDLPEMIAALFDAAGRTRLVVEKHTRGGSTFQRHVEETRAIEKILQRKWDVVVLQEQSLRPVDQKDLMHQFARKLHSKIDQQGARTVFFLTWARQHLPAMQDDLDTAYREIADELKAELAPVGPAWKAALADDPDRVLHKKDKSHPNISGSYLTACVFYSILCNENPQGLPAKLTLGKKTLADLPPDEAASLQKIAWQVSRSIDFQPVM